MKNRLFLLTVVGMMAAGAMAGSLTACAEEVTLTWFVEGLSDEEIEAWETAAIQPFEEANPGIKIEMSANQDYETALKVQLASGSGADLVNLGGPSFITEYVTEDGSDDKLVDLTEMMEEAGLTDIVQEWALDTCKYNGKIYGVPNSYEGLGIYYNVDLFNKYGLTVPTTLDELNKICAVFKENGIIPIAQGSSDQASANEQMMSEVLASYCGRENVKAALMGEIPWTDQMFVDAFTWWDDFWKNGYYNDCKSHTISWNDAQSLFYSQQAAMYITSTYLINDLSTVADFDYDMMDFPGNGTTTEPLLCVGAGGVIAINAGSPYIEEAFKFVEFLFTDDHVAADLVSAGQQPLPMDIDSDMYVDVPEKSIKILDQLEDAMNNLDTCGYCMWTFFPSDLREYLIENCVAVWLDEMTVDEYLEGAQEAFDRDQEAGRGVNLP